ncbi:MAG TPA: type II toxin-antitoxin system RelE/ParE family toxin [Candidatus Limnocylindrales bacterium]|nr:type II toxin-antitoxin system RelE/ParE family toxin [Candidatus Limnocylindrales bacterium]
MKVVEYLAEDDRSPFREWLDGLDRAARARVQVRIWRFQSGNFGDHKSVGGGVWEARLMFGPGYRVYFGKVREAVVVLLGAGKRSQRRDIRRAQRFWRAYLEEVSDDPT